MVLFSGLSVFPFHFPQCPLCSKLRQSREQSQSPLVLFQTDRRSRIRLRMPLLSPSVCVSPAVMLPLHNYFTASSHRHNNKHLDTGMGNVYVADMQRQYIECGMCNLQDYVHILFYIYIMWLPAGLSQAWGGAHCEVVEVGALALITFLGGGVAPRTVRCRAPSIAVPPKDSPVYQN